MASDKVEHGLYKVYNSWLKDYMGKEVTFVEVGIYKGESLNDFSNIFANTSTIYGVDIINPMTAYGSKLEPNIIFIQADQTDPRIREQIPNQVDIVLDDASHAAALTRATFNLLWDKVKPGGIYIIEDCHPQLHSLWVEVNKIQEEHKDEIQEVLVYECENPLAATRGFIKK